MAEKDGDQTDEHAPEVREHLANERTLLSWVRTGVGLISLGIVVERAGALVLRRLRYLLLGMRAGVSRSD